MPPQTAEDTIARCPGEGEPCPLNLPVHDLRGSDTRQWTAIKEIGDAVDEIKDTVQALTLTVERANNALLVKLTGVGCGLAGLWYIIEKVVGVAK